MSFRAYIIGKLDKGKLQIRLQNTAFSQNWMQGCQIRLKLIHTLNKDSEEESKRKTYLKY
jgi:hypothetical protein